MRTILNIALNDLRIIFSDRSIWLNLIVLPIIVSVAVGFANGAGAALNAPTPASVRIDVLDEDASPASAGFIEALRAASTSLRLCPFDQTPDDACALGSEPLSPALSESRLEARTTRALVRIPAGFGAALAADAPVTIVYQSAETAGTPSFILQAVSAAATRLSGTGTAATVGMSVAEGLPFFNAASDADRAALETDIRTRAEALWARDLIRVHTVTAQVNVERGGEGFAQSIPGMASMYVLFVVLPAANALIIERKRWTLQRMATLPITRAQILGGKLLARFVMGMIQYAVLFSFGALVLGVRFGDQPLAMLPLMVAYVACVTALSLALTTVLRTDMQAQGIVLFISLTLAPLGGAWWPLEIVPAWMRTIGHISPVAWAMDGYRAVIFYGGGLAEVLIPLAVLVAAGAALFAFGVMRFRFVD
jgi:ABC-2 type transport system permease protein